MNYAHPVSMADYKRGLARERAQGLRAGDIVRLHSKATNSGLRQQIGVGILVKKMGTVPGLWQASMMQGTDESLKGAKGYHAEKGMMITAFVELDDLIPTKTAADLKPEVAAQQRGGTVTPSGSYPGGAGSTPAAATTENKEEPCPEK